ncbi:hypothetical protein FNH13_10570 [Ornithinimicrobium ciconiae]|uniref:Uncharacterized protein n=1 Tax=Ornithinimicrobium ciconiae TaxID=2594265 RepID=A0A516GB14_9MICO|nr:hypothetical protein [Ornithinimicrobium ciconiae]QDO88716.1 hypothetical protein FNH13_10570 [Ornithinimicrobium ciconiae]
MVTKGLPTSNMLQDLVQEVLVDPEWPTGQEAVDAFLERLHLARGEAAPGHSGRAFRLTGDRELAADYLIVHEFEKALVGVHALANGPAQQVQDVYDEATEQLTTQHGTPEKAFDRRRPPSEVSHWVVGPARVSLFCHADHEAPGRTLQLAIEHIERSALADAEPDSQT